MNDTYKIELGRSMEETDQLHDLAEHHLRRHRISEDDIFAILLGIEEIYTNFVKYNATGEGRIEVSIACEPDRVVVTLIDFDSHHFDPREAPPARLEMPLHERKPGGLGIHIVKQMMNHVEYSYSGRVSTITLMRLVNRTGTASGS